MAHYLAQLSYTSEAWKAQVQNPANRVEIVRPLLEAVGARFEAAYISFGEYDVVFIMEAPDNISAAAVSLAITAGGAVKAFKTPEEATQAMQRAGQAASTYRPPGA